jgi:drug/metabolite transporter (DMT)-like permease
LGERALTPPRLLGMLLALAGLAVVFAAGQRLGPEAHWGVIGMLGSVVLHAVSTVWVKRIDAGISGMSTTAGGLLFAAPAFALTWLLVQPTLPEAVPLRTGLAILYLAAFGSVLGFWLFFYVLRRLEAARVSLIAFVTPVIALLLGHALNGEPVEPRVYLGAALILGGLATYQWGVMRRA